MKTSALVLSAITLMMMFAVSTFAQSETESGSNANPTKPAEALPQDDSPYLLKGGDNEFGGWAGMSFKATTIFEGLSDAEAANRKLFLAAFRYGRTLAANDTLALQYTLDAIPLAVATGIMRFHHISNGDRSGSNRGLNQFVCYAGFSIFK